jgi:hypothetical protein
MRRNSKSKRLALAALLGGSVLGAPLFFAYAELGRYIKGSGPVVYAATKKQKRAFITPECFVAAGGKSDLSDVKRVSDRELATIPEAAPIVCDRSFVKLSDDATVYVVQGGLLRPFPDASCAFKNGVAEDWSNVVTLPAKWRDSYGYGGPVCPLP